MDISRRRLIHSAVALPALSYAIDSEASSTGHLALSSLLVSQITRCQASGVYADAAGVSLNRYGGDSSNPSFIQFEDAGLGRLPMNLSKCSTYITRLLQAAYGWKWNIDQYAFFDPVLSSVVKSSSPQAYQYGQLIVQGKGFSSLSAFNLAAAGDVFAWWRSASTEGDHVLLIKEVRWNSLKQYPGGHPDSIPSLVGRSYVEVVVSDSSASTHTSDTRMVAVNGVSTHIAGAGEGVVGVLLDSGMQVVGITWSLPIADYYTRQATWVKGLNSRLKLAPDYGFALGRIVLP